MFDEIAHEMPFGREVWGGEFDILNGAYGVNLLFTMLMLVFVFRSMTLTSREMLTPAMKEDILFTSAHAMGIVTGLLGLFLTVPIILSGFPVEKFWVVIPFYILFTFPYAVAAALWLAVKSKQKLNRWYEEKQWHDMLQSSFVTMLLSIPGMATLFLLPNPLHFYWFPYYLYLVLTLFSASSLYFYRKR